MNRRSGPTCFGFQFQLALGRHVLFRSGGGGGGWLSGCRAQGLHVMRLSRVLDARSLQCLLERVPLMQAVQDQWGKAPMACVRIVGSPPYGVIANTVR